MGLHLPPKSTLNGAKITDIQKAVRRHGCYRICFETHTYHWFVEPADDPCLEALIRAGGTQPASEGERRGRPDLLVLSEVGVAVMHSRVRKRTPIAKADAAFAELQAGVEALNATGLVEVPEVWIFGSYMRRAAEVGDIDATVFTDWVAPDFDTLTKGVAKAFADEPWLQRAMRNLYGSGRTPAEEMQHRLIFNGRRRPILDGVDISGFNALSAQRTLGAGMPAQRVYTRAGGWFAEQPLPHHPWAKGPMDRPHKLLEVDQGVFSSCNEMNEQGPLRGDLERPQAA